MCIRDRSDADIKAVREHISSFPRVESHYCRAQSQKEYLEDGLNISRMYNLFVDQRANACENVNDTATYTETVSKQMYTNIFNESFNIAFHKSKSDRCDTCEAFAKSVKKRKWK